jgi:hypothetical protein
MTTYSNPTEYTNDFRTQATILMDAYYELVKLQEVGEDFGYTENGKPGSKAFTDDDFVAPSGQHDITAETFYTGMGTLGGLGQAMTPEVRRALNAIRR